MCPFRANFVKRRYNLLATGLLTLYTSILREATKVEIFLCEVRRKVFSSKSSVSPNFSKRRLQIKTFVNGCISSQWIPSQWANAQFHLSTSEVRFTNFEQHIMPYLRLSYPQRYQLSCQAALNSVGIRDSQL